jgi:hypothetical protein
MKSGINGVTVACWLVACLGGALSAGCNDDDDAPATPELTDFERGTIADTRWEACGVESWQGVSIGDSLAIQVTTFPETYSAGVDCVVVAKDCKGVIACNKQFLRDRELESRPQCEPNESSYRCDGDVITYCTTDNDETWHEVTYDCALAGASCKEFDDEGGMRLANCFLPESLCDGKSESYCDGGMAVVCGRDHGDFITSGRYDCADAFGSVCTEGYNHSVTCQGPALAENCFDGADNDGDGDTDCDDSDCDDYTCQ